MTDATTPAAELSAGAEKLRHLTADASRGPWTVVAVPPYTDPLLMSRYEETPEEGEVLVVGSIDVEPADSAYIEAMHPGIGTALADWLDSAAVDAAEIGPSHHALAVARALNQQQETHS